MSDKILTEEEIAEKKAARKEAKKAKKALKNDALQALKTYVDQSGNDDLKKALATIRPSLYAEFAPKAEKAERGPVQSGMSKFISLVVEKEVVSEDDVFKALKIGRKDAYGYIRKHLKKAAPDDRVWINFDKQDGTYYVAGKGPMAPDTYNGPKPSEESVDLQ